MTPIKKKNLPSIPHFSFHLVFFYMYARVLNQKGKEKSKIVLLKSAPSKFRKESSEMISEPDETSRDNSSALYPNFLFLTFNPFPIAIKTGENQLNFNNYMDFFFISLPHPSKSNIVTFYRTHPLATLTRRWRRSEMVPISCSPSEPPFRWLVGIPQTGPINRREPTLFFEIRV